MIQEWFTKIVKFLNLELYSMIVMILVNFKVTGYELNNFVGAKS